MTVLAAMLAALTAPVISAVASWRASAETARLLKQLRDQNAERAILDALILFGPITLQQFASVVGDKSTPKILDAARRLHASGLIAITPDGLVRLPRNIHQVSA